MTNHPKRSRLTIDITGDWRLYSSTLPPGAEALGTVTRCGNGETGALARMAGTGIYVQVNDSVARALDQRKVAAALEKPVAAGRPTEMTGGRRVMVYLDADSLAIAALIGGGNVSEGIRTALRAAADASGVN